MNLEEKIKNYIFNLDKKIKWYKQEQKYKLENSVSWNDFEIKIELTQRIIKDLKILLQ